MCGDTSLLSQQSRQEGDFRVFPILMQCLIHYKLIATFEESLSFLACRKNVKNRKLYTFSAAHYPVYCCGMASMHETLSMVVGVCPYAIPWWFPHSECLIFSRFFFSLSSSPMICCVYPFFPPSSLFVLIMSIQAHSACPQRVTERHKEQKRESGSSERTLCFHRRLLVFHFCHNGLFVYNNLAPTPRL